MLKKTRKQKTENIKRHRENYVTLKKEEENKTN